MSGVDERVERVREAIKKIALSCTDDFWYIAADDADAYLDEILASVASLEQRAAEAEKALRHYANLDPDEVPYRWTINDDPDIGHVARAYFAAAAVVSAEPTEETT